MAVFTNMKTIAALTIAPLCILAGCASSMSPGRTATAEPRSGLSVDLEITDAAAPSFPQRIATAATPRRANQLATRVVAELGGQARADLQLCVDAAGRVTKADVARSSGIGELDAVFATEARSWRYQPLAATDATVCQKVEIAYRVR